MEKSESQKKYNSNYLVFEKSITVNNIKIDQYLHYAIDATYDKILNVDPNNAEQCRELVMIVSSSDDNSYGQKISEFWNMLKRENKLEVGCWTHIIVEWNKKFFMAYACLYSDGALLHYVHNLAFVHDIPFKDNARFLLPQLAPLPLETK